MYNVNIMGLLTMIPDDTPRVKITIHLTRIEIITDVAIGRRLVPTQVSDAGI